MVYNALKSNRRSQVSDPLGLYPRLEVFGHSPAVEPLSRRDVRILRVCGQRYTPVKEQKSVFERE